MRKLLKSKKGMSLIEILVGSLLFGIVAMTVTAVLAPMLMAMSRANDFAEYNTLLDNAGNQIVSDMAGASEVKSNNPLEFTVQGKDVEYTAPEGILLRNNIPVLPEEFYRGKTIAFTVNGTSPNFMIEVTVGPSGRWGSIGAEISRDYAVRLIIG